MTTRTATTPAPAPRRSRRASSRRRALSAYLRSPVRAPRAGFGI